MDREPEHGDGRQQDPHSGQQRADRRHARDEAPLRNFKPAYRHPGHGLQESQFNIGVNKTLCTLAVANF